MISTKVDRIIAPGCLSKLIGGASMKGSEKFLYLKVGSNCLSENDKVMLPIFEEQINNMCQKYCTYCATVIPAVTSFKGVVAFVDNKSGVVNKRYIVPFVSALGRDEEYIRAAANHEFVHLFFKENKQRKRDVIEALVPQLCKTTKNDASLAIKIRHKMWYIHRNLKLCMNKNISLSKRYSAAEEVVCELATNINSPVAEQVFDMVINGNWDVNDLFIIFASISTM